MNNFTMITVDELIKMFPLEMKREKLLRHSASLPDELCSVCKTEKAWKYGGCGMCFSCTSGEADASKDFELLGTG